MINFFWFLIGINVCLGVVFIYEKRTGKRFTDWFIKNVIEEEQA